MGRVWRGHDQLLDRVVAVKEVMLPPQSPAEHGALVARTMIEARAAARLDHPGVVTVYDVVEHDGAPWIVMQYVPGVSLGAEVAESGPLAWLRVAEIGRQVADALAQAHAAGIVHRDLKPHNILLAGNRAIVTDFGIARIIDGTTRLTGTGTQVGTPHYMAPEQLEGREAGPPADMWALGATLYAAVEGRPPFGGPTLTAVLTAVLTRDPDPPAHAGPLAELIMALLAKDPAMRPSPAEVGLALARDRLVPPASAPAAPELEARSREAVTRSPEPHPATAAASGRPDPLAEAPTETSVQRVPGAGRALTLPSGHVTGSRPRRSRLLFGFVAVVVALAVSGAVVWVTHQSPPAPAVTRLPSLTWAPGPSLMPADSTQAGLDGVTCRMAGSCVAVGDYIKNGAPAISGPGSLIQTLPLIETLADGTWTVTDNVAGAPVSRLDGVACPAAGSCVAVGYNLTAANLFGSPVAATLSGGRWTAAALPLPSDVSKSRIGDLYGIGCPAPGTCTAVGSYAGDDGNGHGLIETLSHGKWTAMKAPLPASASPSPSSARSKLYGVTCSASGSCTLAGYYDAHGGTAFAFADTLSDGTWTPVTAAQPATSTGAIFYGVSCQAPGNCLYVGAYANHSSQLHNLAETVSSGTWTQATLPLPADAAAQPSTSPLPPTLDTAACQAGGSCFILGTYLARTGATEGAIDTLSGRTWTTAKAPLPQGAATTKQDVYLKMTVCPSPATCIAVGSYTTQAGGDQPLIEIAASNRE
jgi:Protein kinase domain